MEEVHDASALLLPDAAAALAGFPDLVLTAETLPVLRTLMPGPADPEAGIDRADHVVDGGDVVVTIYRPTGTTRPLPAIYWMHGGGYVMGNRDLDAAELQRWTRSFPCVAAAVEYRLAPEHPYPVPLEDCYAGLCWLVDHAGGLGVDVEHLGIGGRSAGGGLAAALALLGGGERGGPRIRFQLLDSPMLDDRCETPSSRTENLPVWSRESNEFGWRCYLGGRFGSGDVPALAAPGRATDLSGLPRGFVTIGGVDPLRDETIDYAARLNQAGVPTELHVYPGLPHGAVSVMSIPATERVVCDMEGFLGRAFKGDL